jgi:hypothetical protein
MEGEARDLNTFRSGARKVLVRLLGNVLMAGETNHPTRDNPRLAGGVCGFACRSSQPAPVI